MVNSIINGISRQLFARFGAEYEIYKENVTQGLQAPCFLITHVTSTEKQFLGERRLLRHAFDVHYFPKEETQARAEMFEIGCALENGLRYITDDAGHPVRGTNRHYEIVDDVLHFFVNYDGFVNALEQADPMEAYTQTIKVEE